MNTYVLTNPRINKLKKDELKYKKMFHDQEKKNQELQRELDELADVWQAFPKLRSALFADDGTPYVKPQVADLASATREHTDVQKFTKKFAAAFADFNPWLRRALLQKMLTLHVPKQKEVISVELFSRLELLPLIDRYHAYQIMDDHWQPIAVDLEILQTEGFDASRVVEPYLVTKKKDGKEVEVQEGWKGRILPFELVQLVHHKPELDALRAKETRLGKITTSLEETLDTFSEEEKSGDTVNEEGDKFVSAAVANEAKLLLGEGDKTVKFDPESYEAKIIQVAMWLAEEKSLKAAIKSEGAALHMKTKATIENLRDAQVHALLELKWIRPLSDAILHLPNQLVAAWTSQINTLVEKYHINYADNARKMRQIESELAGMIGELKGNEFEMKALVELKNSLTGETKSESPDKIRRSLLTSMFPTSGASTPTIRFKGFNNPWDVKKLKMISSKVIEKNYLEEFTETFTNSAERGIVSQRDYFDKSISNAKNIWSYYVVRDGDFVYNPRISITAPVGPINLNKLGRTGVMSPLYTVFRTKEIDLSFLEYFFKTRSWHPFMLFNGDTGARSDRFSIKNSVFIELPVPNPEPDEQQKIGSFFRKLDELISKHAIQLAKLKQIKSACLERMFV